MLVVERQDQYNVHQSGCSEKDKVDFDEFGHLQNESEKALLYVLYVDSFASYMW